jgi:hypothetical protein
MSKLSSKVVERISKEHVLPIPKWQFLLKGAFVWGVAIVGVLLGAVAVSLVIHLSVVPLDATPEFSMRYQVLENLLPIPYLWLVLMLGFFYVAYHNFIHTESGYKWKTAQILGGTVVVSIVLGVLLFSVGFANGINRFLVQSLPGYTQFGDLRGMHWVNPEEGRIAGRIVSFDMPTKVFVIAGVQGGEWTVNFSSQTSFAVDFEIGTMVKVQGSQTGTGTFDAVAVYPWEGRGRMMQGQPRLQGTGRMMRITR